MKKNIGDKIVPKYIDQINEFFNEKFRLYGNDTKSLGWSEGSQRTRFEVFANLCDLNNKTVLDVGSGFGDLAYFLKKKYPAMTYVGYEINKNFIKNSRPSENISFELRDILRDPPKEKFDAVYSIGALNTAFEQNEKVMKLLIKRAYSCCNELAAVSMISKYIEDPYRSDELHYYDPCKIFTYAKKLSKKVILLHHYLPHDFTIVLFKSS